MNAQAARVAARPPKKKAEHERSGRSKKETDRREAGEKEEAGAKLAEKGENAENESKPLQNGGKRQHDEANDHANHPDVSSSCFFLDTEAELMKCKDFEI